jgi:hypothetical protein
MNSPFFTILPGHDLAYNEIVKPTRRWSFSYYYLYRWLPLLHPQQAMLIQILRQSTWQNGRPTGRCQLANGTLCRLLGWSDTSHKSLLAELERPLTDWFVRRERTRKRHVTQGHAVEGAPQYRLMMEEPLTPRDQAALQVLLSQQKPASPYEAAELLAGLAKRRTRELWALLDAQQVPATLPHSSATVATIARRAWPHLDSEQLDATRALAETAEQCQLRLTGAGYAHMELDYLLRGWLPELGINGTWLVIVLRARCFHDPVSGESRDTVTVSRRELESQLSIPTRTFRRLLRDEKSLDLFHITPADASQNSDGLRAIPHRGDLLFHVAYPLLPISRADKERYESLLLGRMGEQQHDPFSTAGQVTRLDAANQPGWPRAEVYNKTSNPAESGQPTRLTYTDAASQPGSVRPTDPARTRENGQATRLKPANAPDIQVPTNNNKPDYNQTFPIPSAFGKEGMSSEHAEIVALLEPFRIKGLARILQNPALTVASVRAWIYRGRDEVAPHQMGGYLFRRLSSDLDPTVKDPLPACYRLAGEVDEAEERLFEEWWVAELSPPPFSRDEQRARYGAWLKVVKGEAGDPDRPDFAPHACWRREMARQESLVTLRQPAR